MLEHYYCCYGVSAIWVCSHGIHIHFYMYNGVGVNGMVQYEIFFYVSSCFRLVSQLPTHNTVIIIIICNHISTMYVLFSYNMFETEWLSNSKWQHTFFAYMKLSSSKQERTVWSSTRQHTITNHVAARGQILEHIKQVYTVSNWHDDWIPVGPFSVVQNRVSLFCYVQLSMVLFNLKCLYNLEHCITCFTDSSLRPLAIPDVATNLYIFFHQIMTSELLWKYSIKHTLKGLFIYMWPTLEIHCTCLLQFTFNAYPLMTFVNDQSTIYADLKLSTNILASILDYIIVTDNAYTPLAASNSARRRTSSTSSVAITDS